MRSKKWEPGKQEPYYFFLCLVLQLFNKILQELFFRYIGINFRYWRNHRGFPIHDLVRMALRTSVVRSQQRSRWLRFDWILFCDLLWLGCGCKPACDGLQLGFLLFRRHRAIPTISGPSKDLLQRNDLTRDGLRWDWLETWDQEDAVSECILFLASHNVRWFTSGNT